MQIPGATLWRFQRISLHKESEEPMISYKQISWLLWPFVWLWNLVAYIVMLTGRLVALLLGLTLVLAGVILTLTVVGALVGIPLGLVGLLLVFASLS